MLRPLLRATAVVAMLLLPCACATTYEPRRSPRVAVVLDAGEPELVKDGTRYSLGVFSGHLTHAVADNPVALDHAQEYYSRNISGLLMTIAGLGMVCATPLLIDFDPPNGQEPDLAPAMGLMLGGFAVELAGLFVVQSAQPHLWDAINVYNDGLEGADAAPLDPGTPPTAPLDPGMPGAPLDPPAAPPAPAAPAAP